MSEPLAERLRPRSLDDYIGQQHLVGEGAVLRRMIDSGRISSFILWGPPGVGKTTLAQIIANKLETPFYTLSAVTSGVKDVRDVIEKAQKGRFFNEASPILFIDEIHRFSKSQQDSLLGAVERGIVTLIGATTENPSFEVIRPLLSRCQLYVLKSLEKDDLLKLLERAITKDLILKERHIELKETGALLRYSGGDARKLLNILELVVEYETALTLHDSADHADALREWNGYCADVTIAGRALRRDGAWNTLCLPFNMTAQQVAVQLTPAKLMTLSAVSFVDGTLTLSFMDATAIEAGRPYIIRWNAPAAGGGSDLINPTFTGVIVSNAVAPAEFACVDFVGNTSPAAFGSGDRTALFFGADGGLAWPAAAASLNAFRAYFRLKGMVAGLDVKRYVLNLGDETVTGAFPSAYDLWAAANGLGAWDATDAGGVHSVFRYAFGKPTDDFVLLGISFNDRHGECCGLRPPTLRQDGD